MTIFVIDSRNWKYALIKEQTIEARIDDINISFNKNIFGEINILREYGKNFNNHQKEYLKNYFKTNSFELQQGVLN